MRYAARFRNHIDEGVVIMGSLSRWFNRKGRKRTEQARRVQQERIRQAKEKARDDRWEWNSKQEKR